MEKLKKSEPIGSSINICYRFTCPCNFEKYIGETKKRLNIRAQEHQQKSRNTAIYQHISQCEIFKNLSVEKIGLNPRPSETISFMQGYFEIIGKNLSDYHTRKLYEAIQIHLKGDTSNKKSFSDLGEIFVTWVFWVVEPESEVRFSKF